MLKCDVLFHPQLLSALLFSRPDAALMLDYRRPDAPPLGEEETKMRVRVRAGRVMEMGESLDRAAADGENVGRVRFGASAVPALVEILDGVVASGGPREWAPPFSLFAERHPAWAIGTRGFPWIEVDFPEDYERAVAETLPQIDEAPAIAPALTVMRPAIARAASR